MQMESLNKGRILIVEDEKSMREVLNMLLEGEGYYVTAAKDSTEGMHFINKDIFDMVITDIRMPEISGFEILKKVKDISPDTIVIMITAFGTTESAIEAMQMGAYDYIHKPFKIDEIRLVVKKAFEKRRLSEEVSILREKIKTTYELGNIFWKSSTMQDLLNIIPRIARSSSNVLVTGESGTGKELVANAIHNLSPRNNKSFVAVNCAAFPEGLLESELFGHMKGAFTGAAYNKQGLFEVADSGSIFLDEICDMPVNLQAKLLRILENNTFRRVGGTSDIKVDVRIISATNKDIKEEVTAGRFREDLYYRLNVVPLHIPPLRERQEDIPLLVENFLKKFSTVNRKVSADVMRLFIENPWPGNVRELENVIERILLLTDKKEITVDDLPKEIIGYSACHESLPDLTDRGLDLEEIITNIEKKYLLDALRMANGSKTEAAKLLNLSFRSFRHRLSKYSLKQL
ncbi:MAG: sigma-54 dependent transcriptional regulator [Nitrospiraceae bacterium]|nr:sigma-54 dependent transcriptional regulator [Nitrospiraceae bacterium]